MEEHASLIQFAIAIALIGAAVAAFVVAKRTKGGGLRAIAAVAAGVLALLSVLYAVGFALMTSGITADRNPAVDYRIAGLAQKWHESPEAIESATMAGVNLVRSRGHSPRFTRDDMLRYVDAIEGGPRPGETYRDRVLKAADLFEKDHADRDFLRAVSDEAARLRRFESQSSAGQ